MNVTTDTWRQIFIATGIVSMAVLQGCGGGTSSSIPTVSEVPAQQGTTANGQQPQDSQTLQATQQSTLGVPKSALSFTPATVPNLAAWFDASDATTIVRAATKIATWRDKSGNGNDLAPTSSAFAPVVVGTGTSGALSFNGTSYLVGKTSFSSNLFNESSVFIVSNQANIAQTSTVVWSGSYMSDPRFSIRLSEAGVSHFDLNNKADGRLVGHDTPAGPAIWSALGSIGAHTQSFSKNGAVVAHDAGPASGATGNWPLAIGATFDSSNGRTFYLYHGQISEILIFHRSLTATETAQVEGYLACKWSLQTLLPSTHPYRSACPGGAASPTPGPTIKPSPLPSGNAVGPAHVLTAEYFQGNNGYFGSASTMAQWTSWATGGGGVSAALAAGMKTYEYADPWIAYKVDNGAAWNDIKPGGANAAAQSKTCSNVPIGANNGTTTIFTDPTKTGPAVAHFMNSIKYWQAEEGTNTTAMFMDDTANQEYAANKPACNYSAQAWLTGAIEMAQGVAPFQLIANGLINAEYPGDELPLVPLLNTANVMGGMYEDCYGFKNSEGMGSGDHTGGLNQHWTVTENTELAALATGKIFWCYGNMSGVGSAELGMRMYAYANFLLTYGPNALYQTSQSTPSGLRVFPETGIVPTAPLVAAPSSVSSLRTSSGAYGREYANCYYRGALIGACAVVTNPDNGASHATPFSGYGHAAVLSGAGVLDGGAVSFSGSVPGTLGPLTAAILVK